MKIIKILVLIFLFVFFSILFLLYNNLDLSKKILVLRLNFYLQAIIVASILALSGWVLQILLFNPLAEPYLIGVSGAASFGAVISVFLQLTPLFFFRTLFSLCGSFVFTFLVITLSRKRENFSFEKAILLGVSFNSLFSGFIVLLQSFLLPNDFYSSVRWLMGNFEHISYLEMILLLTGLFVIFLFVFLSKKELYIYQTGIEMALSVGVDVERLKLLGFFCVAFATGISVSLCGMIGFVGLIVPHIARMVFKEWKENIFTAVMFISMIIIIIALWGSRNLVKGTIIPLGVLTSIIGAPFFIYLLLNRRIRI